MVGTYIQCHTYIHTSYMYVVGIRRRLIVVKVDYLSNILFHLQDINIVLGSLIDRGRLFALRFFVWLQP
jgi:hypothetical protein